MFRAVSVLALLLCWTSQAWSATRYVSPGGGGSACSESNPCSASTGFDQTQAGDTLLFRGGDYGGLRIGSELTLRSGTSASNQTTFASYPGERATVFVIVVSSYGGPTYQYITFDGFDVNCNGGEGGIFVGTSSIGTSTGNAAVHHITIKNTEVRSCANSCIHAVNATDVTFSKMHVHHCGTNRLDHCFYSCGKRMIIEDSDVHDASGYGLQIYYHDDSGDRTCNDDTIIRRNRIHDLYSTDSSVTLDQGSRILFYNNLVYNTTAGIRSICQDAYGTQVFNNTFYGLNDKAVDLCGTSNVQNTQIKNNIIANSGSAVAIAAGATGTVTSNNLCYSVSGSTFGCDHSGDPQFNNAGLADFRIKTGSAAKNQGTNTVSSVVTNDASSPPVARPSGSAYDIGAYEFDEGGGPIEPGPTVRYMAPSGSGGNDSNTCAQSVNRSTPKANFGGTDGALACMSPGDKLYLVGGTYNQGIRVPLPSGTGPGPTAVITIASAPSEFATLAPNDNAVIDIPWDANKQYITFDRLIFDCTPGGDQCGAVYVGRGNHHIRFTNVEIKSNYNTVVRPETSSGIATSGEGDTITFQSCNIHGFQRYASYVRGTNWVFDGCDIHHNGAYGIHIYDQGQTTVSNNIVRNSFVHHNSMIPGRDGDVSAGIVLSSGSNNQAYNNVVYANGEGNSNNLAGIQVGGNSTSNLVYNNTIYGNGGKCISIDGGSGAQVKNNLCFGNGDAVEIANGGASTDFLKNMCESPGGIGCDLVTTNPLFANLAATPPNFQLQATSPAVNAGTPLAGVPTDIAGVSRPQPSGGAYDIGAYELSGSGGGGGGGGVVKAFPTAEGYGANSVGGRGGRVIEVKNLNDSGADSLRSCVEATGARTCVFTTGGTINLNSNLNILAANSYLTIAGQTAPGGGIQLKNWFMQIMYGAHDVIIRHLKVRPGAGNNPSDINNQCGGIVLYGPNGGENTVRNVIIDHTSIEWSCDDSLNMSGLVQDTTVQWSIIGEGMNISDYCHPTSGQCANSKGFLIGDITGHTVSFHHNMMLDVSSRVPAIAGANPLDFRNNLVYNWYACYQSQEFGYQPGGFTRVNYIGNKSLVGPSSGSLTDCRLGIIDYEAIDMYATDNSTPWCERDGNCATATFNQLGFIGPDRLGNPPVDEAQARIGTPHAVPAIVTHPVANLEVLLSASTGAGATVPARDSLDTRLITEMQGRSGTMGRGGDPWPTLAAGTAPTDTDHDGMPDSWETSHDLNPNNINDGPQISGNGYSNVENYLNTLAGDDVPPASGGARISAGTFWIAPSGVDPPTRTCATALNNIDAPLLTFNAGRACLTVAGDKLFLRAGSYEDSMWTGTQPIANGTGWTNATTIAGYGTEVVTLSLPAATDVLLYFNTTNQYIILDRLILDCHNQANSNGLAMTTGAHHIRFQNGEIRNCHFEPIFIENSDNNEILTSSIHGSAIKPCINLVAGSDGTWLQGNTIHTCPLAGIEAGSPNTGTVIRDNVIHDTGTDTASAKAAIVTAGSTSPVIINNVVYNNYRGIHLQAGTTNDAKVLNNTVHGNATQGVQIDATAGAVVTNNIVAANTIAQIVNNGSGPTPTTNLTTAPPFDPAFPNKFHLTSAATAAIDVGTPLTADVPKDYEGIDRPQGAGYDIGASEFVGTIVPEEPPPGIAIRMPYWRGQGFFWR